MAHSIDLRKRVVGMGTGGGSKMEAARWFRVSGWCIHDWYGSCDPALKQHGLRPWKLGCPALRQHVTYLYQLRSLRIIQGASWSIWMKVALSALPTEPMAGRVRTPGRWSTEWQCPSTYQFAGKCGMRPVAPVLFEESTNAE